MRHEATRGTIAACAAAIMAAILSLAALLLFLADNHRAAELDVRAAGDQPLTAKPITYDDLPDDLGSRDDSRRRVAIEWAVGQGAAAIPALLEAIDDENPWATRAAGEALLRIAPQSPESAQLLAEALSRCLPDGTLASYAQRALVRIGPAALPVVVRQILRPRPAKPESSNVRHLRRAEELAADRSKRDEMLLSMLPVLATPGDRSAVGPLVDLLRAIVSREDAPGDLSEEIGVSEDESLGLVIKALQAIGSEETAAELAKLVVDAPGSTKALWTLSQTVGPRSTQAVDVLIAELGRGSGDEARIRAGFASEALARIGRNATPALVRALSNPFSRSWSLHTLEQIGPEANEAITPLMELVSSDETLEAAGDENWWYPWEVSSSYDDAQLTRTVGELALDALISIGAECPEVATYAVAQLERLCNGDPWARFMMPSLKRAPSSASTKVAALLDDDAISARIDAAWEAALKEEGAATDNETCRQWREQVAGLELLRSLQIAIVWTGMESDESQWVEVMGQFLARLPGNVEQGWDSDPFGRSVASALGEAMATQPRKHERLLRQLLAGDEKSRNQGIYFARFSEGDIPEVVAAALRQLQSAESTERVAAVHALGACGKSNAQAIVAIADRIESDSDDDVKVAAFEQLRNLGARAKPALPNLLRELDYEARKAAMDPLYETGELVEIVKTIGDMGPGASEAVGRLLREFESTSSDRRDAAAVALGKIAAQAPLVLPALERGLIGARSSADVNAFMENPHAEGEAEAIATAIANFGAAADRQAATLVQSCFDRDGSLLADECTANALFALANLGQAAEHIPMRFKSIAAGRSTAPREWPNRYYRSVLDAPVRANDATSNVATNTIQLLAFTSDSPRALHAALNSHAAVDLQAAATYISPADVGDDITKLANAGIRPVATSTRLRQSLMDAAPIDISASRNNVFLTAALAVCQLDGTNRADDVATVLEAIRWSTSNGIDESQVRQLIRFGRQHPEIVPLMVARCRGFDSSDDPDSYDFGSYRSWRYSQSATGDAQVVLAIDSSNRPVREWLEGFLRTKINLPRTFYTDDVAKAIELLAGDGDPSPAYRRLLAEGERHQSAKIRQAATAAKTRLKIE